MEIASKRGGMNGKMLVNGDDTVDSCEILRQLVNMKGNYEPL